MFSCRPKMPQVASALAARHIGGAVNYVAVAETTGMSSSAQAAGLAADNLICAGVSCVVICCDDVPPCKRALLLPYLSPLLILHVIRLYSVLHNHILPRTEDPSRCTAGSDW